MTKTNEEIKQNVIDLYVNDVNQKLEKYGSSARIKVEQEEGVYLICKYYTDTIATCTLYGTDEPTHLFNRLEAMNDGIECFFEFYIVNKYMK